MKKILFLFCFLLLLVGATHGQYAPPGGVTYDGTGVPEVEVSTLSSVGTTYIDSNRIEVSSGACTLDLGRDNGSLVIHPNGRFERKGGFGYFHWGNTANYPQVYMGNSASAVQGYIDVDNNAPLALNILDNGEVIISSGGLYPENNLATDLGTDANAWGTLRCAEIDIKGTAGTLIVSRMTTTDRNNLTPVDGMIIYNTTTNQFEFRENGAWVTK